MIGMREKLAGFLPRLLAGVLLAISVLTGCGRPQPAADVSVLLISVDSLRVDRLPLWNPGDAPPTPNLDRLAARGTVYQNAWATSPWTAPSMVSVFTGLYPPSHGIVYRDDTTPETLPTLPRLLAQRGYRLGNFSFFSGISYFRNLGLGPVEKGIGHKRVAGGFRRWLAAQPPEQPFFAWVHLLEPHLPYGASGYRSTRAEVPGSSGLVEAQLAATVPWGTVEFEDGDRDRLVRLYDRDVRRMDGVLGRVLGALEVHGRAEETL
ncbi:MAG: sulfatase-like hydrolase/transferase, partial [Thermoanaerobaculia bacterium]